MPKEFAIIGLGRFGSSVAEILHQMGNHVLAVDMDEHRVSELANHVTHAVQADATDEHSLRSLGIRNFDYVIVAIGEDLEASILVTLMLKELGVKTVVAKASTEAHGKVLQRVGADRVVFPEKDMGVKVARSLGRANILDYIELTPEVSVVELAAGERLAGRNLRQLDLRSRFQVTVLAIRRGQRVLLPPDPNEPVYPDDILVAIGENDRIGKLQAYQEKE